MSRGTAVLVRAAALMWLVGCAVAADVSSPRGPPDTMAARMQGCSTCHGKQGEGMEDGYFPRIAGKPAEYLFKQLKGFRDGRRNYPPMNYLLAYMDDDYLQDIALYFSSVQVADKSAEAITVPTAALIAGAKLFKEGDIARRIPACVGCHGLNSRGINAGIPGLVGLRRRYISAQIEAWRNGIRHSEESDCMKAIANLLSEDEVSEVAAWIAGQPETPILTTDHPTQASLPCGGIIQ